MFQLDKLPKGKTLPSKAFSVITSNTMVIIMTNHTSNYNCFHNIWICKLIVRCFGCCYQNIELLNICLRFPKRRKVFFKEYISEIRLQPNYQRVFRLRIVSIQQKLWNTAQYSSTSKLKFITRVYYWHST